MKLGMINSAWEQHGIGLVDGLHKTKELGFDCVDIFQDPLDDNADDRIATIKQTCDELQLPIISVVGVSVGLVDSIHQCNSFMSSAANATSTWPPRSARRITFS